jgi:hypothetical protein
LCWGDAELGVVGLVGHPFLEPWDDARRGDVVGRDVEVERAAGCERAEENPSVAVARGVDVDGDSVVVAVATLIEARLTV